MRVKVGDKVSEGTLVVDSTRPPRQARERRRRRTTARPAGRMRRQSRVATADRASRPRQLVTPAPRGEKGRADTPGEGPTRRRRQVRRSKFAFPTSATSRTFRSSRCFVKPGDIVATRRSAGHARVRQGDDGRALADRRRIVEGVRVAVGERVSEGTPIVTLKTARDRGANPRAAARRRIAPQNADLAMPPIVATPSAPPAARPHRAPRADDDSRHAVARAARRRGVPHASPSVRKFARELGVDLARGDAAAVRRDASCTTTCSSSSSARSRTASAAPAPHRRWRRAFDLPPWPSVDFAKFGPIETKPLSRIQKISGANLHRNWVTIPHVTQFDDADITDLEAFRVALNKENEKSRRQADDARLPDQGLRRRAAEVPRFQRLARRSGENLVHQASTSTSASPPTRRTASSCRS